MSVLFSAVATLASVLGIWTALSVAAAPVVACCIRSQARANDRRARGTHRASWQAAGPRH